MKKEHFSKELHALIREFCLLHNISLAQILSFHSATLVASMAKNGFTDEFGKKTFESMYTKFLEKKKDFKDQAKK